MIYICLLLIFVFCIWLAQRSLLHIPGYGMFDWEGKLQSVNFDGKLASSKFGKVYKIWNWFTPVVVISDYNLAMHFYSDHMKHTRDRDFGLGPVMSGMLGNAIGTKYGAEWTHHAKNLKFMQSEAFINEHKSTIYNMCEDYINEIVCTGQVNISETMNRFTIGILARIMYGELSNKEQQELMTIADLSEELIGRVGHWNRIQTDRLIKDYKNQWRTFNNQIMSRNLPTTCGLYKMLQSELSVDEVLDNLDEILLFNIDVMYSALGALIVNLSRNIDVQHQIYKHIRAGTELNIIDEFIAESARHDPSIYLSFPEKTQCDRYIGEFYVRKDTTILIDADIINSRFPDSDKFILGRSGTDTPKTFHRFGLGPRTCIGKKFAQVILRRCTYHIVRRCVLHDSKELTRKKTKGSCFFTPYIKFPTVDVSYRSTVMCGISIGNSFYNSDNISGIFSKWSDHTPSLITFIPEEPSYHTYAAKLTGDISDVKIKEIRKKCRGYASRLAASSAQGKIFEFVNIPWENLINKKRQVFDQSLINMHDLYDTNTLFKSAVNEVTLEVVSPTGNINEDVKFLLKELALIVVAPTILGVDTVIYSYHRSFPIVDNVLKGLLGYPKVDSVFTRTLC